MNSIFIADFGLKNGTQVFRVNGNKEELIFLLKECVAMGHKFDDDPEIEHVYKNNWTVLLKIKVPVEVGAND